MRGGPTDVAALLKKFGGLLGRPTPYQGEDFNLSLVVHRLNSETRERLEEFLRKAAPAATPVQAPVPAAPVPPAPVPTAPSNPAAPIVLAPPASSNPEPLAPIPPVPVPLPIPLPPVPENPAPPIPELKPQIPEIPALIPLAPEPASAPPPLAAPEPKPEPVAAVPLPPAAEPAAPAPVALTPPSTASAAAPAGPAPIGFALAPRPDWTMETLLVGAYNRFAHAAATQVISSPGSMYNPLFLFGVPGTGKSHMLHAISASLSKGLGGAGVFVTTGPRLSRGVNAAAAAKSMAEIDKKVAESKALLIDDIHLMAVSDQNKDALAKIFKAFFDRQQQVVITSGYPPRALGALEEALKFSFSKGWSVDLKIPSPAAQKDLIAAAADHAGGKFAVEELAQLHEKLSQWGYQELGLWLRRLMILKEMREAVNQPATVADLLPLIYDPVLAGGGDAPRPGAPFQPPPAEPGAAPLAVIVPKDQVGLSTFTAGLFHETGAKYSFRYSYRHALWESYDSQQPFGVPFLIGDLCARAGVTRALVLGPTPDSPLGPRSAEFAQAVRRILDNIGVEMGWIPYGGITTPAHYLNAHLDFAAASRAR
jgi:chromosomal replication initiator protein